MFEQFKVYVPNVNTKLGHAYTCVVRDSEGTLPITGLNFLRENPALWLRALSLYSDNLDFVICQTKARLKAMAPMPGEAQTPEYLKELKEKRAWSIVQEHKRQKIKVRRNELVFELGYSKISEVVVTGDLVAAFNGIIASITCNNLPEAMRLAENWIYKLTGKPVGADDPFGDEPDVNPLQDLLSKVRKGRDATQD